MVTPAMLFFEPMKQATGELCFHLSGLTILIDVFMCV